MKKLDCLGQICPIPVMRLQNELSVIGQGEEVMLVTDHSCTCKSVQEFCRAKELVCSCEEVMNGIWEITIRSAPESANHRVKHSLQIGK